MPKSRRKMVIGEERLLYLGVSIWFMISRDLRIGGQADPDGILFSTRGASVLVTQNDDQICVVKRENRFSYPKFWDYPFLRGILMVLFLPVENVYNSFWRSKAEKVNNVKKRVNLNELPSLVVSYFYFLCFISGYSVIAFLVWYALGGYIFFPILSKILIYLSCLIALVGLGDTFAGKQLLQYHGAEHKILHAYNKNLELSLENVKLCPKENVMCGSSLLTWLFLFVAFVPVKFHWWYLLIYISLSYELIRYAGRNNNWISKIIFVPGYVTQLFLTREPTSAQLRLGIQGLKSLLATDEIK